MISQKPDNIRWPEEETPPPLKQKQTSIPASSWRTWSLWLRVLGVVVALVVGFALLTTPVFLPLPVYLFLVGVVSAGLLRSWGAILVVPVAFGVGIFLSLVFQVGGFNLQGLSASGFEGVGIIVVLGVVPLAIGVAIGITLSKWIERRLQH